MAFQYSWEVVRRQATDNTLQPTPPQTITTPPPSANTTLYLGIGIVIGVGIFLLPACILIVIQIVRKRAEHERALAELEQGYTFEAAQRGDVPRTVSFARVGGGWGALGSNEEVNEDHPMRKRRSYVLLPKRMKQRGVPMKRMKHLSAIIESTRSRDVSAQEAALDGQGLAVAKTRLRGDAAGATSNAVGGLLAEDDVFVGSSVNPNPNPTSLPSFAIRSPGRYSVRFVEDSTKAAKRSYPVGASVAPQLESAVPGNFNGRSRMHTRSISLGAQAASLPPAGPVPPLPVIATHNARAISVRNGFCLSRMSSSSSESASSSVLVTSPIVRPPDIASSSPSLEQIVADDEDASLKTVSHRQWQNPLIAGPRPVLDTSPTVPAVAMSHYHKPSISSNVARYSADSRLVREVSTTSVASSLASEEHNRLFIPRLGTADRVGTRSVSSIGSFKHDSGIKNVTTPRRISRCSTIVSENGSPAERQKSKVLRDISGNANMPTRQASNATQASSRSSNGNPFQWDSAPLTKPSTLKGSPNARKGHRRQNCIRISTLTPQVLGPPPSRQTSQSIMHGIEEEPLDFDAMGGLSLVPNQSHPSQPLSLTAFAPHLRISTLRASLTSSSPVLSIRTTFQDQQILDAMSSRSASPAGTRSGYRQPGHSSNFSIPSFPSPSKTTVTAIQRDQPVPEFYCTRPSTDEPGYDFGWDRENDSPIDVHIPDEESILSSPPLPSGKDEEYDPTCPTLFIPKRNGAQEYDPAGPALITPANEPEPEPEPIPSSPYASTITLSSSSARCSRPVSYSEDSLADSPPCSPKTMPHSLFALSAPSSPSEQSDSSTPRGASSSPSHHEDPTSANASPIMARILTHSPKVDFPGAPILLPPIDDNPVPVPLTSTTRNRSLSTAGYLHLHHSAPPPPLPGKEKEKESSQPERTFIYPSGPRLSPPKPISEQISALRRMNSEMDTSTCHQSRLYIHGLSRVPAQLSPWVDSESSNDTFDFDSGDVHGGADATSALDNVDLSEMERRLEGALAGFDVPVDVGDDEDGDGWEGDKKRESSVWENGEKFWNRTSLSTIAGSSPSEVEKAKAGREVSGYAFGGRARRAHMRSPSVMETPRSLYDAQGFFKET
jgi:hypothetical protein